MLLPIIRTASLLGERSWYDPCSHVNPKFCSLHVRMVEFHTFSFSMIACCNLRSSCIFSNSSSSTSPSKSEPSPFLSSSLTSLQAASYYNVFISMMSSLTDRRYETQKHPDRSTIWNAKRSERIDDMERKKSEQIDDMERKNIQIIS